MSKALTYERAGTGDTTPRKTVTLTHDQRHLRRKLITLDDGTSVLVDLAKAVALEDGDMLVLEDGERVRIVAASEPLLEVTGRNTTHLARLCWHIGNRHLPAQIDLDRILIGKDHVIAEMLTGLGASVREVVEPFSPERGAYHTHASGADHRAHENSASRTP